MIKGNCDITDEEYDEYLVPYNNNFHDFMIKYVVPEIFAFKLASSYYRECLCNATLEQHCNSMCDVFNGFQSCLADIISETNQLLQIKYNLKITNENPLILQKWQ